MKLCNLRPALRFASLPTGIAVALAAPLASAQDPAPAAEEATTLDRIEVTGSRIKRADIETSQPIFTMNRDDIQAQGLTSIGDVIQNITTNGSALNTGFNNAGNGEANVNLRNLGAPGPARTLVLVNGRRWVGGTGLGGAVDLNTIPTAAVERIEVLKDGASTIYGSDAITGVVNIILRRNFDGAEANAYLGTFDKGDGFRESYDFLIGSTGERWSAMVGFSYVQEEPVMAGDREISKEPIRGTGAPLGGSGTTPNGRFGFGAGTCDTGEVDDYGFAILLGPGTRLPGGGCVAGTLTNDGPGTAFRPWAGAADIYNFAPENYLLTPQERRSVFASGGLDITDNLRFRTTMTYNERLSEQLLASSNIVAGTAPGATPVASTLFIDADNFYNQVANGGFGEDIIRINRRVTETGGRSFNQDVRTFAMDAGFEGTLTFGEKYFDWEAGYFYGENQANNTTRGLVSLAALRAGIGPSMMIDGVPSCVAVAGDASTVIAGCVPVNLIGGAGSITPEMLAFIGIDAHDEYNYTQKNYYADIGGDLFEMPGNAGPFAFSLGVEHREESGYDSPDALINSGQTNGSTRTATSGAYDVDEAYLELAIPVLKDLPFARLLDFSVATRYSDYSNFGNTLNSKFGFRWKPIDDLLVRGNWTEGFRAPSIAELFAGQADNFPTLSDPCNVANFPNLPPQAQARCLAEGVPAGGYVQDNPQIRITAGGNPNLQPETAVSKTIGLVYSPSWVEGLDIALDWWNIKLEDAITTIGGEGIIQQCVDSGGSSPTCALYTRNADGNINTLLDTTTNIGGAEIEGYDLTVGYRLPETAFGKFSFVWDTTYMAESTVDLDGDGIFGEDEMRVPDVGQPLDFNEGGNLVGEADGPTFTNNWRIRSNVSANWEKGDWGATWNVRYYSSQQETCQAFEDYGYGFICTDTDRVIAIPVDANNNGVWDGEAGGDAFDQRDAAESYIRSTTYHDVSAYVNVPWNARITLGVNNAFDKEPPFQPRAFANSFDPAHDIPGRFFYVRYSQKF